jgi:spermidine synthase
MRYLVSFAGDGRCYEQAEVTCAQDGNTSSSESSSGACSGASLCHRTGGGDALLSYLKSMAGGALANGPPESTAVLGFGSGALSAWLADTFPDVTVDSVDLNADVIAAAPCFGVNPSNRLSLIVQDGRSFLEGSSGGYSAIFVDAFDGSGHMPGCMATSEFFALARDKLRSDGGVLAVNLGLEEDTSPIVAAIKKAFLNVAVGHAPHETNTIVIASQMDLVFDVSWEGGINPQVASQVRNWAQFSAFKPATEDTAAQPRTDAGSMCGM